MFRYVGLSEDVAETGATSTATTTTVSPITSTTVVSSVSTSMSSSTSSNTVAPAAALGASNNFGHTAISGSNSSSSGWITTFGSSTPSSIGSQRSWSKNRGVIFPSLKNKPSPANSTFATDSLLNYKDVKVNNWHSLLLYRFSPPARIFFHFAISSLPTVPAIDAFSQRRGITPVVTVITIIIGSITV